MTCHAARAWVAGVAGVVGVAGMVWLASPVAAASPTASAATVGDPRSSGQGPGLVGEPLLALVAVLAIGLAALVLTLVYIRLTGHRAA